VIVWVDEKKLAFVVLVLMQNRSWVYTVRHGTITIRTHHHLIIVVLCVSSILAQCICLSIILIVWPDNFNTLTDHSAV